MMAKKQNPNVDTWLQRETKYNREALENASRYFDENDNLTVNTLEAVYGRESSFGLNSKMGERGSSSAAGHFQFEAATAKRYGLSVSKNNDQRFDIDYASSAAARYLKDLDTFFSKNTTLSGNLKTVGVKNASEREKFVLGAFNAGEGNVAKAQHSVEKAGKNPQLWADVEKYLTDETRQYILKVLAYQGEFALKSPANKKIKQKEPRKEYRCTDGHWVTIDDRPVFICD
jgi:membrane-bound lytic murein transglycosylase MltF